MATMMDEPSYNRLVDDAFSRISTVLDRQDPDDVEVDTGGGYLTLGFRDGSRCVISTQRPVREIWMAADATAWHFQWQAAAMQWVAAKTGDELLATVSALVTRKVGRSVSV